MPVRTTFWVIPSRVVVPPTNDADVQRGVVEYAASRSSSSFLEAIWAPRVPICPRPIMRVTTPAEPHHGGDADAQHHDRDQDLDQGEPAPVLPNILFTWWASCSPSTVTESVLLLRATKNVRELVRRANPRGSYASR